MLIKSKFVPVYAIRFLSTSKKERTSQDSFIYTVIYKAALDLIPIRYQPQEIARRQVLGIRQAEIGVTSSIDHDPARNIEKKIHSGGDGVSRMGDLVVQGRARTTNPDLQRVSIHHPLFSGGGGQRTRMRQNGVREKISEGRNH